MTLKGRKNHYNVKLLRGYGVSITLKDNKISLKNGTDVFGHTEKEEYFVTRMPYEKIVISGRGYVSTDAIKLLSEKNVNVILTDTYGNLVSSMNGVMSSATSTRYRMGQYDATTKKLEKVQLWLDFFSFAPYSDDMDKNVKDYNSTANNILLTEFSKDASGEWVQQDPVNSLCSNLVSG